MLFDVLTNLLNFPNLPFMYNGYLRCFFNFAYSEHYISSEKFLYRDIFFGSLINWEETFQQFPLFLKFLSSSLIFSHFLGSQTPSVDDNSEDEWLNPLSSWSGRLLGRGSKAN